MPSLSLIKRSCNSGKKGLLVTFILHFLLYLCHFHYSVRLNTLYWLVSYHLFIYLLQEPPTSGIWCLMIWGGADVIITEIKCTINVIHLNDFENIPHSWFVGKLSSTKPGPDARKTGDYWCAGQLSGLWGMNNDKSNRNSPLSHSHWTKQNIWKRKKYLKDIYINRKGLDCSNCYFGK